MSNLWTTFLPLMQDLNTYGGNFTAFHIRREVLDALDDGAAHDQSFAQICAKLEASMKQWSGLQDHTTFSALFEAYYEGAFYLTALRNSTPLLAIVAGSKKGSTPDFTTANAPVVNFEVKTIDVASPTATYDQTMEEGLNANLEAQAQAEERAKASPSGTGVGMGAREIRPHGDAANRLEVVEQVMKKIDSNVKAGQYKAAPTILVVSTVRTALHDRAPDLRQWVPWPNQAQDASGQLFAIAAHQVGQLFYFFPDSGGYPISNLGPLQRAGILRDHPCIAGLIFLHSEWTPAVGADPVTGAYALNGIWNTAWEQNKPFGPQAAADAKSVFMTVCDAWNDVENSRNAMLPAY